jgi:hypothetical protein
MGRYNLKKKLLKKIKNLLEDQSGDSAFDWSYDRDTPQDRVLNVSKTIRGVDRKPAIILHGIMRRSGTNYIGELIGRHPNIYSYPGQVWEVPLLSTSPHLIEAQKTFINCYKRNRNKFRQTDFLPLFGSSFIAYLHSFVPEHQRMLIKVPNVDQIWNFANLFPDEKLVILERDGRDIVASTMKTWPHYDFNQVCIQWQKNQELILKLKSKSGTASIYFAKFEDAVFNPKTFVKDLFEKLGVDGTSYPYDQIDQIPLKGSSEIKVDGKVTWEDVKKPKSFNPMGRWRSWSDRQKATFKKYSGPTLIRSGYSNDMNW